MRRYQNRRVVSGLCQILGFKMFAMPVLNYIAQLYTLPDHYAVEVHNTSASVMLGLASVEHNNMQSKWPNRHKCHDVGSYGSMQNIIGLLDP